MKLNKELDNLVGPFLDIPPEDRDSIYKGEFIDNNTIKTTYAKNIAEFRRFCEDDLHLVLNEMSWLDKPATNSDDIAIDLYYTVHENDDPQLFSISVHCFYNHTLLHKRSYNHVSYNYICIIDDGNITIRTKDFSEFKQKVIDWCNNTTI